MNRLERSQVIIIVAFLFMILFLLIAIVIDGSLMLIQRQELLRLASSAGKAGLLEVGNQIMTQASIDQIIKQELELTSEAFISSNQLGTLAPQDKTPSIRNTQNYQATLISPPIQTQVASSAQEFIDDYLLLKPQLGYVSETIIYPYQDLSDKSDLEIWVQIRVKIRLIFGSLLFLEEGEIIGESIQSIQNR
jgi:hypothetical protein